MAAPRFSPRSACGSHRQILISLLVALISLVVIALANLAGRPVTKVELGQAGQEGGSLAAIQRTTAGWPLPYVEVFGFKDWPLAHLKTSGISRSFPNLAMNALLALLAISVSGLLLGQWLSHRPRVFQFGLFDVVLLMTAVAAVLGYGIVPRWQFSREEALLAELTRDSGPSGGLPAGVQQVIWEPINCWPTRLLGEQRLPAAKQVVGLAVAGDRLGKVTAFPHLRGVAVRGPASAEAIAGLERLRELTCLDLHDAAVDVSELAESSSVAADGLRLPGLKQLRLRGDCWKYFDLAGLTALEEFCLEDARLNRELLHALAALPRLRSLGMRRCHIDEQSLIRLQGHPGLTDVDLSGTPVSDDGVAVFRALPRLRRIWLCHTQLTDAGLTQLAANRRLRWIGVTGTSVTGEGIRRWTRMRPDCAVLH